MKKLIILLTVLTVLAINSVSMAYTTIHIDDGAFHTFDDDTYLDAWVYLDYYTANAPGTHVNLVNDGAIGGSLYAYNNATITMNGGSVERWFSALDNSTITMNSGVVGDIMAGHNSTISMNGGSVANGLNASNNAAITMTGGTVGWRLSAYHNATIIMSGGSVGYYLHAYDNAIVTMLGGTVGDSLRAYNDGVIQLVGTEFKVNDTSLENGDKLSDFDLVLVENGEYDYYTGTITGTLADGSALNNAFRIYNTGENAGTADIVIIPEPCSLVLLGLGVLALHRRGA